jgi:protoporphyrinogen oxidase
VAGVATSAGPISADAVLATPALPIIADLLSPHVAAEFTHRLRRIDYLANVCLVLQLDRRLSGTYWLNVNDPHFPFVGVIEHTNFEPPSTYAGRHIVYLSKYLSASEPLFHMTAPEALEFALPHIQRMFPSFRREWIQGMHLWRARYAQPVVVRRYSRLIPPAETPLTGCYIATMAQIYPEDRGTNYAVKLGRRAARRIVETLSF